MRYKTNNSNDNKVKSINARCTPDEKEKIMKRAKVLNKSESEYILDCCMAGTERRSGKIRKMLVYNIQMTEQINHIHYLIKANENNLPKKFIEEFNEEINKLGGINRCLF